MRREFPKRIKAEIVHRAMNKDGRIVCEGCGLVLGAKLYEIDHVIAEALIADKSAALTAKDGQLLGMECCHRAEGGKTAQDVTRIAKAVRQSNRHLGIRSPSKWNQKYRRKVSGETVLRSSARRADAPR